MSHQHRNKSILGAFLFALFASAAACGAEAGAVADEGGPLVESEAAAIVQEPRTPGVHEEIEGEPAQELADNDTAENKANNSYVQWCNQSGPNGTVCRQQNCSGNACYDRESAAISECKSEVNDICGSATTPFYIVFKADGYWFRIR